MIFTLRYNDNFATYVIDYLVLPLEALIKNLVFMLINSDKRCVKKQHGYRRTRKEIVRLAAASGFELISVHHAGYGIELTRSTLLQRIPGFISAMAKLDKSLCLFNNVTVFEFKLLS